MVRWVLLFRVCGDIEYLGEFCELGSSQCFGEQFGGFIGGRKVLHGDDLFANVFLEMLVPKVYKFAAFGGCAVVSDLDGCDIVDVEWRRPGW